MAADDTPERALRRMKLMATGLLVAMAALFAAASLLAVRWPAAGWVRAFAEAAMVGACADWFAVTAIFRRPLGLPIPHTGVIPRNKNRIGAALGDFIADNFLTEAVLQERLRRIELAQWGADWLRAPGNAAKLAERLVETLPDVLSAMPSEALRRLTRSAALAAASAVPAADVAGRVLAVAWSQDRPQAVIERLATLLRDYFSDRQEVIVEQVHAQSYRWLPAWVDRIIARKITGGIFQLLADVCDPDHPWRLKLDQTVEEWTRRLAQDPELRARADAFKQRVLGDERLAGGLDAILATLEARAREALIEDRPALARRLAAMLCAVGTWLQDDAGVQAVLNDWSAATIRGVIAPRRHEIGRFIAAVVASWDVESTVDRLELQVGRDLQFIRINGTVVGGLVGLLIYALAGLLHLR